MMEGDGKLTFHCFTWRGGFSSHLTGNGEWKMGYSVGTYPISYIFPLIFLFLLTPYLTGFEGRGKFHSHPSHISPISFLLLPLQFDFSPSLCLHTHCLPSHTPTYLYMLFHTFYYFWSEMETGTLEHTPGDTFSFAHTQEPLYLLIFLPGIP